MKCKRFISIFLLIVMTNSIVIKANAPNMNVNARSSILMEATTGKVFLAQNEKEEVPIASVTKVMTMLLIYEAIDNGQIKWTDIVTVSEHAAGMGGSQVFLEAMEQQSVRDLVKSISIASANDASVAMAEYIAGSEDGFVIMMNQKAKSLGMNNTNFVNACGLDEDNHYSSALDVAIMSRELISKYPEVFEFTKTWQDKIVHKTARGTEDFGLANTNKLIKSYSNATGLKTGSTSKALFCLSGTAEKDGLSLIAVILGAESSAIRFHETIKMFDYGFANYSLSEGEEIGTIKGLVKVYKGNKESVDVCVKEKINLVVGKGNKKTLEHKVEIVDFINAPINKGVKAGEIIYMFEGKVVGKTDLITTEAVKKADLATTMKRLFNKWFK